MPAPDGSNPLARIDVGANNDGTAYAICDCLVELQSRMYSINLQDLVTAAHEHAKVCPLHLANLAVLPKYRQGKAGLVPSEHGEDED